MAFVNLKVIVANKTDNLLCRSSLRAITKMYRKWKKKIKTRRLYIVQVGLRALHEKTTEDEKKKLHQTQSVGQ